MRLNNAESIDLAGVRDAVLLGLVMGEVCSRRVL